MKASGFRVQGSGAWWTSRARRAHSVAFLACLLVASPAFAQNLESKVQNLGTLVINVLSIVAVLVGTAASLIAGMKYMGGDPQAREQVKGIAIGAFFAFAAAGIVQAMKTALT